jgi:hypothetical protein
MTTTRLAPPTHTTTAEVSPERIGLAALAALAANLAVYAVASAADATWLADGLTVSWYLVAFATAVSMLLGAVVTRLLARKWAAAPRWLAWIGLAVGLVTVPSPFLSSSNAATALALAAMHAITGVAWFVAVLPRRTSAQA